MRELAKEADRVREDDRPAADAVEARVARVERREEAVLGELLRGGEAVEEGRLAGVRVADEGDGRDVSQVPAADVAARLDLLEIFLEGRDPPADLPLVELELLLAAARAEGSAAPLLGHAGLRSREAREEVLEPGELDLRHRLAAPGSGGEDGEDDVRAVEDLRRQLLLEVAGLRGGELVVEDDHARLQRLRGLHELLQLPLADVGRRIGGRALLEGAGDDDASRRVDEALQLVEVVLGLGAADRLSVDPHEDRFVRLRSGSRARRPIVRFFLSHNRAGYQQSRQAGPKETLARVCSRADETASPAPGRSALASHLHTLEEAWRGQRLDSDPLLFPHRYERPDDREAAAFLASSLAFGRVASINASSSGSSRALGPEPAPPPFGSG